MLAVSKRNINTYLIFSFLDQLRKILIEYFKNLEEESIRDNFVLIYELMDEIIDHGYPQLTETKILKEYIKTESKEMKIDLKKEKELANTLTNAISWRQEGIKYKKNEAYLDVIEKVDSLVRKNLLIFLLNLLIFLLNLFRFLQMEPYFVPKFSVLLK